MEDTESDDYEYIYVLGIDRKLHLAKPWESKCKCGVKILNKKISENDREYLKYYSCYECTY